MQMKPQKKRALNQFLKFSNIAIQMGVIISIGAFVGNKLDAYFEKEILFTASLSLIAVFVALYHVIKEVIKLN